jgi:hypothetical protein
MGVEGVVPTRLSLKEQVLFYTVNNKNIHFDQIDFQN